MGVQQIMKQATTLQEIQYTCRYRPLDVEELKDFYVDTDKARGVNILDNLLYALKGTSDICQKVLFLGHAGSGKSTIFSKLVTELSDEYIILRFSVQDFLNIRKMDLTDLLCIMYKQVLDTCEDCLSGKQTELKKIYETWFAAISHEEELIRDAEIETSGKVEIGTKHILKLLATITSVFKMHSKYRDAICTKIYRNIPEHVFNLNELLSIVKKSKGKPILFMFEDLEKIDVDSANTIFLDSSKYLADIHASMLITTPIYLKYNKGYNTYISQYFTHSERCPMIAVRHADGSPNLEGINTMKCIARARVAPDLISDGLLEELAKYSGGVIRDLLWLLVESAKLCRTNYITQEDIARAFQNLQELSRDGLREIDYSILMKVYTNPYAPVEGDEELDLMRTEKIIEYNGKQWRGVHPALIDALKQHENIE